MPLTKVNDIAFAYLGAGTERWEIKLERPAIVASIVVTTIVATVTPVPLVVALHKALTIGLLELIRVTVSAISTVVAMAIAIKVRTLRIVILAARGIIRAGVQPVLITLLRGHLVDVVVSTISPAIIPAILPVIGILIVRPALRARC